MLKDPNVTVGSSFSPHIERSYEIFYCWDMPWWSCVQSVGKSNRLTIMVLGMIETSNNVQLLSRLGTAR